MQTGVLAFLNNGPEIDTSRTVARWIGQLYNYTSRVDSPGDPKGKEG
jgi:hypothetical protein